MTKKKECQSCKIMVETVERLTNGLKSQEEKVAVYRSIAEENRDAKGELLKSAMELERERHKIELIKLIVAGKQSEAVEYLLAAKPILFTIDVRFADDATEIAAKTERANTCATIAAEAVRTALMPKGNADATAR